MKQIFTLIAMIAIAHVGMSQWVTDSVSIGAGYSNQVWYNLENGEVDSDAKTNWDMAFEISGISSSIRVNHVGGTKLWLYPNGDTSAWNTIDTNGLSAWTTLLNSDTNWSIGAANQDKDFSNDFDMGWGVYDLTTHHVTGNRLFILETTTGSFKKMIIERLAGGTYFVRHANLDGSDQQQATINKTDYIGENFGYYSFADGAKSREPLSADWNLLFTQYADVGFGGYPSTGVLLNGGVKAVKVYPVDDVDTYENYENHTFSTEINTIGFNWKSINFTTFQWDIADSTMYFVENQEGDVWKIKFTGFGGSSNGNYYFSKEEIYENIPGDTNDTATSVVNVEPRDFFMEVYPNPAANGFVNVSVSGFEGETDMQLFDLNGRLVEQTVEQVSSIAPTRVSVANLPKGMYMLRVKQGETVKTSRLIIQ